MRFFLFILLATLLTLPSFSQNADTTSKRESGKPLTEDSFSEVSSNRAPVDASSQLGDGAAIVSEYNPLSSFTFYLSIFVLVFGLIIIALETYLVATKKVNMDYAIKFITVTLIVTGTLFLITAGYSNNQIAPAMGLLGTIAGYLLGKSNNDPQDKTE